MLQYLMSLTSRFLDILSANIQIFVLGGWLLRTLWNGPDPTNPGLAVFDLKRPRWCEILQEKRGPVAEGQGGLHELVRPGWPSEGGQVGARWPALDCEGAETRQTVDTLVWTVQAKGRPCPLWVWELSPLWLLGERLQKGKVKNKQEPKMRCPKGPRLD